MALSPFVSNKLCFRKDFNSESLRKFSCLLVQVLVVYVFATGSPGGEREVDEDGGGDVGLVRDQCAGMDDEEGIGHATVPMKFVHIRVQRGSPNGTVICGTQE
ncbi:hypothetical protein SMC3_08655 [Candidatus Cryosericum hinesii]|jgi:hypothetical protein|uniref:Uncharacterized protein n=1 Tax=Candidatus Cryosericum hinesii TaxID=2290915 RepID=A0A398DI09_9BACT|nr:hypothetical protein SMC4_07975 [Candidatus Cryosericum hinesii]RIE11847.1 hypothetical protein SMC3_08655 [Candidatus Cryosericum hinesii]RIE12008.1 hypothetical protein SMC2_08010 [Candidatus Cryosericum hinesii]